MDEKRIIEQVGKLKGIRPDSAWKRSDRENIYQSVLGRSADEAGLVPDNISLIKLPYYWLATASQPVLVVFLVVFLVIASGAAGTWAAKDSTPGDSLYIAKIINEKTQQALTFDEVKKARLGLTFAGNRARELRQVLQEDGGGERGEKVEKLVSDFKKEISQAKGHLARAGLEEARRQESKQTPITTEEQIDEAAAGEEEEGEGKMFSANLGREENGIQTSEQVSGEAGTEAGSPAGAGEAGDETATAEAEADAPGSTTPEADIGTSSDEQGAAAAQAASTTTEAEAAEVDSNTLLEQLEARAAELAGQDEPIDQSELDELNQAIELVKHEDSEGEVKGEAEAATSTAGSEETLRAPAEASTTAEEE